MLVLLFYIVRRSLRSVGEINYFFLPKVNFANGEFEFCEAFGELAISLLLFFNFRKGDLI